MRVAIASDHGGFDQKGALADFMATELSCDVTDFGPETGDSVDYPDYAVKVAQAVSSGDADFGVLICGTGIGMAMAADKVPGVRAANIINSEFAALCREHNDANVITLSGRFVPLEENERILDTFFATDFGGGRHAGRVQKIMELD